MSTLQTTIDEVANKVAKIYARRCWWADFEDLRQEAYVAALEASATYTAEKGEAKPYLWKACACTLAKYLWRESSPVKGKGGRTAQRAGLEDAPIETCQETPEHSVAREEIRAELLRLIEKHYCKDVPMLTGLLGGNAPEQVAEDCHVEIVRVYKATEKLHDRVRVDAFLNKRLQALYEDL